MKKLINFKDIDRARKILGLGKTANMEDIKSSYRRMSLKYHPDKYSNSPEKKEYEEKIKEINSAYKILMSYCIKYPLSFDKDKVKELEEGEYIEDHLRRFYDDWWGDID